MPAADPPIRPPAGHPAPGGAASLDALAAMLAGRYPDPESGELLGTAVRAVAIEPSLRDREVELLAGLGAGFAPSRGTRLAVVGDEQTFAALGDRVVRVLASRFTVQRLSLGARPHADAETLARLVAALEPGTDAIVAVGSGTLNDLCKLAARARGCPQAVFATAPSMNGYTSVSASITEGGLKRSIRAAAPVGVFFDLGVLAAAPPRLIRAGLGDSLCRPTAQADWLLAHLLLDQPYREAPFALLAADEQLLFAEPRALLAGDLEVMRSLARILTLSGFGMTLCDGSYPASQGEHLISHYAEMMGLGASTPTFHGEQIGVTALAMARLQRHLLDRAAPPELGASALSREELCAHFGAALGESCWRDVQVKRFEGRRLDELRDRLATRWPAMRERLLAVSAPPEVLATVLIAAGALSEPQQLGWSDEAFATAVRRAREIRNRYTFLDLAADAGVDPVEAMAAER
jgi:glycerol-1-phosphate dehydrogenase [NAD(P)+]